MKKNSKRIGFLITTPFHYQFYEPIANLYQDPIFVIEILDNTPFTFDNDFIEALPGLVLKLKRKEIKAIDGVVDVLFCMTHTHLYRFFKQTKTVALQHGCADESYQFGLWRCVADLNIMFGQYSYEKVKGHCVAEIVGNVRMEGVNENSKSDGGILYVPSHVNTSSLPLFLVALSKIDPNIPIKIQIHHALLESEVLENILQNPRVQLLSEATNPIDAICEADMVLSDYSDAIFDALYLKKPVALIQKSANQDAMNTDVERLVIARAADIGPIAYCAEEVPGVILDILNNYSHWETSNEKLSEELFNKQDNAAKRIVELVEELLSGFIQPNLVQRELRAVHTSNILNISKLRRSNNSLKKKVEDCTLRRILITVYKKLYQIFIYFKARSI